MNWKTQEDQVRAMVWVLSTLVALAIGSVSFGLYADDRYAKNKDLKQFIAEHDKKTDVATNMLRKQMLEDKIFELDLVPDIQKTDLQRAMANRNKTQLQEVQTRISAAEQEKR
jgi:chromatin segregation and condensation protein Rec8/ScpA/Scc1 (kleisin family)